MKQQPHLRLFGIPKLAGYLPGYGRLLFAMVFFGTLGSVMDVVIPLFQQYAIDHFIADGAMNGLGGFLALYVLVMLVQTASNYISAYGACKAELYIGRDLKRQAFDHLQTLSFSYFNQNSVGYVHARVMSDTDRIASTLAWGLMEGVWYIAYLLFAIVMMFVLNWKLALGVMVIVPVLAVSGVYFQKKLVVYHRQVRERNSQITGAFNEGITGAKTTKTLVIEDRMEQEFDSLTGEMKRVSVREMRTRSLFMSTTALAASVALAIVLWRGGIITREGVILVGTLSVFMNYAQGMMEPIQWLVQVLSALTNVQVNVERFTKLMETESDVRDTPEVVEKYGDSFHPKKENWEPLYGDIEFRDVTFRYPDGQENILEHFNLKVPQGTNVAIVGETGAGKSTLVNLVCRSRRRGRCSSTGATRASAASSGSIRTSATFCKRRICSPGLCWRICAMAMSTRRWSRSRRLFVLCRRTRSLRGCRRDMNPTLAKAATACPPVRSSCCRLRARCWPTRASLCSTRQPAQLIP